MSNPSQEIAQKPVFLDLRTSVNPLEQLKL